MRKCLKFEIAIIACLILVLTVACSATEATALPKVHRYTLYQAKPSRMGTPELMYIRYPQIRKLSNKKTEMKINKTLKNYAEKVYENRKKFIKENPPFKGGGEIMKSQYGLSYKVRYFKHGKLSIEFSENEYSAGAAHGVSSYTTYNFLTKNGKNVSLKTNFKSNSAYQKANHYVQTYMKKHKDRYYLAFSNGNKPTIYGHSYFWTNHGLKVQFAQYEVAPFALGAPTLSIPEKFLRETLP